MPTRLTRRPPGVGRHCRCCWPRRRSRRWPGRRRQCRRRSGPFCAAWCFPLWGWLVAGRLTGRVLRLGSAARGVARRAGRREGARVQFVGSSHLSTELDQLSAGFLIGALATARPASPVVRVQGATNPRPTSQQGPLLGEHVRIDTGHQRHRPAGRHPAARGGSQDCVDQAGCSRRRLAQLGRAGQLGPVGTQPQAQLLAPTPRWCPAQAVSNDGFAGRLASAHISRPRPIITTSRIRERASGHQAVLWSGWCSSCAGHRVSLIHQVSSPSRGGR